MTWLTKSSWSSEVSVPDHRCEGRGFDSYFELFSSSFARRQESIIYPRVHSTQLFLRWDPKSFVLKQHFLSICPYFLR